MKGNNNKIQNEQHRELSLIHIEHMDKLGDTVEELEGKVKVHATIKYSLLLIIFLFIIGYIGNKCYKMPKRVKEKVNKSLQDDKILDHENALLEMGYLKPRKKKKKNQVKNQVKKNKEVKQKKEAKVKEEEEIGSESEEEATELV